MAVPRSRKGLSECSDRIHRPQKQTTPGATTGRGFHCVDHCVSGGAGGGGGSGGGGGGGAFPPQLLVTPDEPHPSPVQHAPIHTIPITPYHSPIPPPTILPTTSHPKHYLHLFHIHHVPPLPPLLQSLQLAPHHHYHYFDCYLDHRLTLSRPSPLRSLPPASSLPFY
ncbi:hypothetical protein E2C01_071425 [Portunus trituberculatus]|uniref:Uncharacterized protein n=1 Tax=Portunus trituberculatus TaxID=210409 RepID=A0A5B7I7Y8_PORTR|nr:hypothetical protein [Portunus trituberculatus]